MRERIVLVLDVATFLAAAKTHGRQLRLERELATWGTAGWWALTLAMGVALCCFAWRRPA